MCETNPQAILDDDGFLSRGADYRSFEAALNLSRSLFSDQFIAYEYDPLATYFLGHEITIGVLERFNFAAERVIETVVRSKQFDYAHAQCTASKPLLRKRAGRERCAPSGDGNVHVAFAGNS